MPAPDEQPQPRASDDDLTDDALASETEDGRRAPTLDPAFEELLEFLRDARGFDFTGYKRSSLMRRVRRRMQALGVEAFDKYLDLLQADPAEFEPLFNTILINVTRFFRDGEAWEALEKEVIPRIIEARAPDLPIRVWSAGCSTGEEAYTIAILLAEALGADAYRERVKIYATDVDEEALEVARQGTYPASAFADVPEVLRDRYFDHAGQRYTFRNDLRRTIIFGRIDLVQDAPISKLDLLICRNTLMYFNAETQARTLTRFHFALRDTGFLFVGKAEMLLTHGQLFQPLDLQSRIFEKVGRPNLRERLLVLSRSSGPDAAQRATREVRLRETAFDAAPVAQLVIDPAGDLAMANEQARLLFRLDGRDIGRPFQDLEISYRPLELRSLLEQARTERRVVIVNDVAWERADGIARYEVQVVPLLRNGTDVLGTSIHFHDVTHYRRLHADLEESKRGLELAYEELQATNEELETTNEELQSTVEELETTNEELQSTNEELETMNEELESTNEELDTMNEELRIRTEEVVRLNAFLEAVLASLRTAVVVLDPRFTVTVWSARARDLWGLREDEAEGHSFFSLDIGLRVNDLAEMIRTCRDRGAPAERVVEAVNRKGRPLRVRVSCTSLAGTLGERRNVILFMEEWLPGTSAEDAG